MCGAALPRLADHCCSVNRFLNALGRGQSTIQTTNCISSLVKYLSSGRSLLRPIVVREVEKGEGSCRAPEQIHGFSPAFAIWRPVAFMGHTSEPIPLRGAASLLTLPIEP